MLANALMVDLMKPGIHQQAALPDHPAHAPMSFREFVLLISALMALNALAIDVMLPALQQIGSALSVQDENQRQTVLSAYLVGFGVGQLLIGSISDRFGRRAVLLWGLAVYVLAAALCSLAPSFGTLLLGRVLQGLASAAPRVTRSLLSGTAIPADAWPASCPWP
jgi:DHA1 family bicyclomycin/chloramphenicol resistance-like MFS transporter